MGRIIPWKELLQHNTEESLWTVIHGDVYDVTDFLNSGKHPGGDSLLQSGGKDATALFESTHVNAWVGDKTLKTLPVVGQIDTKTIPDEQNQYTYNSPFHVTLKKRVAKYFRDTNQNKHDHPVNYIKIVTTLAMYFYAWFQVMIVGNLWWFPVASFGFAQIGINIMHDAAHGGTSRNWRISKFFAYSMDMLGGSNLMWRMEHNMGHHIHTNMDNDPDTVSGFPIMRFQPVTEWKWWHEYQHIYTFAIYAIVAPRWALQDMFLKIPEEQHFNPREYEWKLFYFFKVFYVLWALVLPSFYIGWKATMFNWLITTATSSYFFALLFAPTHISADAEFPSEAENPEQHRTKDWATLQVTTATNYSVGGAVAFWFSGGLNYQIEHHLFPSICHPHYAAISPIVRKTCKEFGIPYTHHATWFEGVRAHHAHLYRMGQKPGSEGSKSKFAYPPKVE